MTLAVEGLVAGYTREVPILRGVSVRAESGRVTAVIGPNGAGKSTLLKTVYGYLAPAQGRIDHDGRSLLGAAPKDMLGLGIAYLLQGRGTFAAMTVHENLELGAWLLRRDKGATARAFERVYARFPMLREKRRLAAGVLSGGEQRLLEIARLTMTGPKTLLLDEPSVGLMPALVEMVYDELKRLKDEGRFTILMVDQNVKKAIEIADYVYVLRLGENDREGPQDAFRGRLDEIVRAWI